MFGELPDAYTVVGAAFIVAAGLYIFWREQLRRASSDEAGGAAVTAQADRKAALAGIGLMLLGVFLFSFNDAVGKWLVATYSVSQLMLIRSGTTMILLIPLIWRAGRAAFTGAPRPGLQVLRVLLSTAEVVMFFWAVGYLPLADAITFYLAGPIYVTAFSALLLKEKVGWRRWCAVLVGFAGVVIALRPSAASFTLPALIALDGSVFFALLMIVTRIVRDTSDTVLMTEPVLRLVRVRRRHGAVRLDHAERSTTSSSSRPSAPYRSWRCSASIDRSSSRRRALSCRTSTPC